MIPPQKHPNEANRLEALRRYAILDTLPEQALDDLVSLTARICETPIALISLVDEHRQWFKSKIGLNEEETPRDISFCGHALLQPGLFTVPDATQDARFADNPLVTGELGIRFYAGAPLVTPEGAALGTLCVKDRVPRTLTPAQEQALQVLAGQVMIHLELRRHTKELLENQERLRIVTDNARVGLVIVNRERRYTYANETYAEILGLRDSAIIGCRVADMLPGVYEEQIRPRLDLAFAGQRVAYELHKSTADGNHSYAVRYEPTLVAGVVEWVVVVITDITDRKLAETELQRQHAEMQLILDSVPALIFYKDREGRFVRVNRALAQLMDRPPEDFIGKTDAQMGSSSAERYRQDDLRVMDSGHPIRHVEEPLDTVSGKRWLLTDKVPHRDEAGHITGVIGLAVDITERKLAELGSSRMAAIVASSDDAIIGKDLHSNITSWNRGAEKIFGYTAEEMVGTSIMRLIPADRRDEENYILNSINRGESVKHFETQRLTKDGRLIDISVTVSPIKDATGKVIGISKVARDISERRKAEAKLRETQARLQSTLAAGSIGTWTWDIVSNRLVADEFTARMFGMKVESAAEGLSAEVYLRAIHEEDRISVTHALEQAIRSCGLYDIEYRVPQHGGEMRWLQARGRVEGDDSGQAVNFHGAVIDITGRKRNEGRIRRLVDSNVQGVMFWNAKGEITDANDAFLNVVGFTREDLHAGLIRWNEITPPEYAERDCCALAEISTVGICAPLEKEYIRKDGSRVPVLVGAAAFEDSPDEGICFVLDLTERKKLEQQFLRAQRMESIGTLAGGIAHDLNNVLGPIIMSLDLLKMRFPDAENQELLSIVSSSAQRGADMVRQVLSFARGVEGRRMEVQVKHLIRDIEKIANDTLLKHIQVHTIVPHDLWTVLGDPTQLHQVLLNLCVNARDAMPQGGSLTISAENRTLDDQYAGLNLEARPGPYVFIQVEDSGTGIPPDILEKIFDPFFTTKEIGKGTGLGLSTSMAIVKSHGGFIQVYSEVDQGTKFRLYFPAQTEIFGSVAPEAPEMPRGNGELILVVDDETSVRQITQQTLQAFGYRVILACDGVEAVAVYATQSEEIAVVLTDMMMPVMDGLATIRVLQKLNPAVRIIAASGLAANGNATQAAGLDVKHFLPKPYTAEVLLKALRDILSEG